MELGLPQLLCTFVGTVMTMSSPKENGALVLVLNNDNVYFLAKITGQGDEPEQVKAQQWMRQNLADNSKLVIPNLSSGYIALPEFDFWTRKTT